MNAPKLTAEMQAAVAAAKNAGGLLGRYPGGFWQPGPAEDGKQANLLQKYYGTTTVEALVKRGVMAYSKHKASFGRQFPIEATLVKEGLANT